MKKFDLDDILFMTRMQKYRLASYKQIIEDANKKERQSSKECVICYYDSKIGGAAMTSANCKICDATMTFGSTNVDKLCKKCASEHALCRHCGADINLKQRKKM